MEEEKKESEFVSHQMVLRSDHFDHPMRFERAVDLLIYRAIEEYRSDG